MEIYQLQQLIKKISRDITLIEGYIKSSKINRSSLPTSCDILVIRYFNQRTRTYKKELAKLVDIQKALKKDLSAQIEAIRYNSIVDKFRKQLENS